MNLDGTNRMVVQDLSTNDQRNVPFGIGAFGDKVYYIDRTRYVIFIIYTFLIPYFLNKDIYF